MNDLKSFLWEVKYGYIKNARIIVESLDKEILMKM